MFSPPRTALEAYAGWLRARALTATADHLLQEVRLRLRQLEWTFGRCMALNDQFERDSRAKHPPGAPQPGVIKRVFQERSVKQSDPQEQAELPFQPQDELWILLESFYYSAHRVRDILRDNKEELPGLHTFEAVGVRTARNHLVEHTGRAGGVRVPSIACGGPVGPQLRFIRWSLDAEGSNDPGLRKNASEFAGNLTVVLLRHRSERPGG